MDDGTNTGLVPIYNGFNRPDVLQFSVGIKTVGLPYRFAAPTYISSCAENKTITIGW